MTEKPIPLKEFIASLSEEDQRWVAEESARLIAEEYARRAARGELGPEPEAQDAAPPHAAAAD